MSKTPYSQHDFVVSAGTVLDSREWAMDYRDNLFAPLPTGSLEDFVACSEVSQEGKSKRISAPHSSTALAANTFDWWRGQNLDPIGRVLGVDIDRFVGFEQAHHFGLNKPCQPDVEFTARNGSAVAVEVKLREPYGSVSNHFAEKYFGPDNLWHGLPNLKKLAETMRVDKKKTFQTLHAAQLIKHALGLRHSYGDDFALVYYWHYLPSKIGDRHKLELAKFREIASLDITFIDVTVEQLLRDFDPDADSEPWLDYMTSRYISSEHPQQ